MLKLQEEGKLDEEEIQAELTLLNASVSNYAFFTQYSFRAEYLGKFTYPYVSRRGFFSPQIKIMNFLFFSGEGCEGCDSASK